MHIHPVHEQAEIVCFTCALRYLCVVSTTHTLSFFKINYIKNQSGPERTKHVEGSIIVEIATKEAIEPSRIFDTPPPLSILLLSLQRPTGSNAITFGCEGIPIINEHTKGIANTTITHRIATGFATNGGTVAIAATAAVCGLAPGFGNAKRLKVHTRTDTDPVDEPTTTNKLSRGFIDIRGTVARFQCCRIIHIGNGRTVQQGGRSRNVRRHGQQQQDQQREGEKDHFGNHLGNENSQK